MTLKNRIRINYDETGQVATLLVPRSRRSRHSRSRHPGALVPYYNVRRAELRELCDLLHDLADDLDRKDREATDDRTR
ncbi:hypothetical protein [Microbacterium esteraromaticum]|uniref:hypothetical protein n=1 Tax=Microbacterium esteraromaticum TaxID=57043 RepID=UPI0019D404F7|nr:hypothetical protein [Microbacterium esteraromaticum]MBN7792512.1 hypothetical protein [Microbacterium esteraromaticum]